MKLDLGSGHVRIDGWLRVDLDPEADADFRIAIQDLEKHFKPNTIDEIRAYHVLEHVRPKEVFPTMRSWWKVLKPGGKVTIEVPDCEGVMIAYAKGQTSWAEVKRVILGADQDATEWMVHRNLFNTGAVRRFFEITGFVNIKKDTTRPFEVVNMSATKPTIKKKGKRK
jgi:predicted SAM-dependent methyltransferase